MDVTQLKEGQTIKNYKELCIMLGEKVKTGGARENQLKWFNEYFTWHKEGNKFIIDIIFNKEIKSRTDARGGAYNIVDYSNFKVRRDKWYSKGVYSIILNDNIYIGSTNAGFRCRFLKHNSRTNTLSTYKMLQQGAIFEIVWLDNTNDESFIRQMECKYINYYRNKKEWNVVNERDAWSYTQPKIKYKSIKINENKLDNVINFLEENNIEYKE